MYEQCMDDCLNVRYSLSVKFGNTVAGCAVSVQRLALFIHFSASQPEDLRQKSYREPAAEIKSILLCVSPVTHVHALFSPDAPKETRADPTASADVDGC